jgi:hypothetical protein
VIHPTKSLFLRITLRTAIGIQRSSISLAAPRHAAARRLRTAGTILPRDLAPPDWRGFCSVHPFLKQASQKYTTPHQPNMLAGRRCVSNWALKFPSVDVLRFDDRLRERLAWPYEWAQTARQAQKRPQPQGAPEWAGAAIPMRATPESRSFSAALRIS